MPMYLTAEQFEAQMPDASLLLSDEPEMESSLHYAQLVLLVTCLEWLWREGDSSGRQDFFIGANLSIYFSRQRLRNRDFRGPDFFVVKSVANHPRKSWVIWEEDGRYPDLIIELLSDSTAEVDRTVKKELYQTRFRTAEYFWFSPETQEFMGFQLVNAQYQEIQPTPRGWRWSHELGLYLGVDGSELRYFTAAGEKVPTPAEAALQEMQRVQFEQLRADRSAQRAEQEHQRAEQEHQRAEQERQRAEQLAERLRQLGIDPE